MADIHGELGTLGTVTYRHTQIAWVPRFDRSPWLELAVVQRNFAIGVDDDGGIKWRLSFLMVGLHDGEDAPNVIFLTSLLELIYLGIIETNEEFIIGPNLGVETGGRIFREDNEIEIWVARLGGGNHAADFIHAGLDVLWGVNHGDGVLNECHQKAVGRGADASGTRHGELLLLDENVTAAILIGHGAPYHF